MRKLIYFMLGFLTFSAMAVNFGNIKITKKLTAATVGMIYNASMIYSDSDTVTFEAGSYGDCNGSYWEITSNTDSDISSPTGEDFYYFYIDDSASSYPTPTIINSTTEPAYSATKKGWYNGNDRCIGAVFVNSSNAIAYFTSFVIGNSVTINIATRIQIASSMNPDNTWQTPDDSESSVYCPVNAVEILLHLQGADSASGCSGYATSKEIADNESTPAASYNIGAVSYDAFGVAGKVPLGSSRNVRIAGADNDDNALGCWVKGFVYEL